MNIKICLFEFGRAEGDSIIKDWKIERINEERSSSNKKKTNKNQSNELLQMFFNILKRSGADMKILQKAINIYIANDFQDENASIFSETFKFDVVNAKTSHDSIQESLAVEVNKFSRNHVVIVPAVSTRRPPVPPDFPVEMVIAVGCSEPKLSDSDYGSRSSLQENIPLLQKPTIPWQSSGSTLDFVCPREDESEIKDPWAASYYATAIATIVIFKAYALGKLFLYIAKPYLGLNTLLLAGYFIFSIHSFLPKKYSGQDQTFIHSPD